MAADYHIRNTCRLCDAALPAPELDLGETALANELWPIETGVLSIDVLPQDTFPLHLCRCVECEHVQLPVVVKPERLFPKTYPYRSGTSPVMREHLRELAKTIRRRIRDKGIIEIGSNDGTLLQFLEKEHFVALGIDPAASGTGFAIPLPFTMQLATWIAPVRLIVALNMLAHVDNIKELLYAIEEIVASGPGRLILEVGYWPDVLRNGDVGVIYHEHLAYWHLTPLMRLLERFSLPVYDVERIDSQCGSIRVYAGAKDNEPGAEERVAVMLEEERDASLSPASMVPKIEELKRCLASALEGLKRVAAFGASAKLTTFCAATGWQPHCVFDDNPEKIGKRTPGQHKWIWRSEQLASSWLIPPDALVITSYNFASEIVPRLRQMGYRGRIIVPLPIDKFEVING